MAMLTDHDTLTLIDDLQQRYVSALDNLNMQGWLSTFAQDGQYRLTTLENEKHNLPLSLMMDDCHARLLDRVKFVDEVWGRTVEAYQPRHFVQRGISATNEDGEYEVHSNFSVYYTNKEGHTNLLVVGRYRDLIVREGDGLKFKAKTGVMDTAVPPRYIIYPI